MRRAFIYVVVVLVIGLIIYAFQPPKPIGAGQVAPDVQLEMLNGERKALSDYKGKVVVLDFWATWCAPCQFTMPKLEEFYQRHKKNDVVVIGVAVDIADPNQVRDFVGSRSVTYPIAMDHLGEAKSAYQVTSLPTLLVIDRNGVIAWRMEGYDPQNTEKEMEAVVQRALAETPSGEKSR